MRRIISLVLVITVLTGTVSLTVRAESDPAFKAFQEYNYRKIQLKMASMELYQSGVSIDAGASGLVEKETKHVPLFGNRSIISWLSFCGDKRLTEDELYTKLGLSAEAEQAGKLKSRSRNLFYGGGYTLLGAFGLLCILGIVQMVNPDSTTYQLSGLAGVVATGGAVAMVVTNKRNAQRLFDFPHIYRLAKKDNLRLLKTYFPDADLEAREAEIEGLRNLTDIQHYEYKDLGQSLAGKRTWNESALRNGATREEVLDLFGLPDSVDSFGSYSAWDYIKIEASSASLFNWGVYTGDSYNDVRYSLYFKDGVLADWLRQDYASQK